MTKREFEKWKRYCYDHSNKEMSGYLYLHKDCPQLDESEKDNYKSHWFKCKTEEFIIDNNFVLKDKVVHYKWVKKMMFVGRTHWPDLGGKRESKLNWILKNINN